MEVIPSEELDAPKVSLESLYEPSRELFPAAEAPSMVRNPAKDRNNQYQKPPLLTCSLDLRRKVELYLGLSASFCQS
jgi:hypothetical protein